MNLDRVLAILGVLISLPGFFLLFLSGQATAGALTVLLGVAVFAGGWFVRWRTGLPPYTILDVKNDLAIQDRQGATAQFTREYRIRPNYGHLTELVHRNIAADGPIVDFRWNDAPLPADAVRSRPGELQVAIRLNPAPSQWKAFPGKFSYRLERAFPAKRESYMYVVDFPTKRATVRILLPEGRPCTNALATETRGAGERQIEKPEVTENGRTITLSLKNPPVGVAYTVYWDW